jgi:autotransporter-associated beta strand protein
MTFDTASVGAFTIGTTGGPTLVLTNGGTIQMTSAVANNETINAPISLAPASSITSGSYSFTNNASSSTKVLTFGGGITGGTTTSSITLTLNGSNTGNNTISGVIGNGTTAGGVAVTKSGPGTWVLTGTNTFTGTTNISGGTLSVGAGGLGNGASTGTTQVNVNSGGTLLLSGSGSDHIRNSAAVALSGGGIINTGGLSEGTRPTNSGSNDGAAGVGALTLQSTSSVSRATIDFLTGANGSTLAFSSLVGGNGAFLDIKNWTGTPFTDNSATGNDRLLFGVDPGLTAAQLANVRFFDDSGAFIGAGEIIGYGNMFELVAVPEPGTWLAAALALSAVGFSQRKRLRAWASSAVERHS